jgi:hypothetical protein
LLTSYLLSRAEGMCTLDYFGDTAHTLNRCRCLCTLSCCAGTLHTQRSTASSQVSSPPAAEVYLGCYPHPPHPPVQHRLPLYFLLLKEVSEPLETQEEQSYQRWNGRLTGLRRGLAPAIGALRSLRNLETPMEIESLRWTAWS